MGCSFSKASKDTLTQKERRRLSLSQSEGVVNNPDSDQRGKQMKTTVSNVLELFPDTDRRLSLQGKPSEASQRGFDNKDVEQAGNSNLNVKDFNMGVACKKGLKPESPNQDDFFLLRVDDWGIYAVFDGHGPYGHDISNFTGEILPSVLVREGNFQSDPSKALTNAFVKTHNLCEQASNRGRFDCSLSGTTCTVVLHRDNKIITSWCGDSRAVLGVKENGRIVAQDLSKDHKPERPDEKARISAAGGQVRRLEGDIPHRVFLKGKLYPGLAMTRSIGDSVGASAGVTSEPDITVLSVQPSYKFILLCSDGVWEFISSQEAVDIVAKYPPNEVQKATETLAQEAWKRWIDEEGNVVDDITVIVVWLS